jgi:hypothetical protein
MYEYWIVSPTFTPSWSVDGMTDASLSTETPGTDTDGTRTIAGSEVTESPWASIADAVAVSVTPSLSRSACVTEYGLSAVQVSDWPGARPGSARSGQVTEPAVESETDTGLRSTLPVFVTTYEYWIVSPSETGAESPEDASATLTADSPGAAATAGTVTRDGVEAGETNPVASVPVAVAESITAPASTSLCWTT